MNSKKKIIAMYKDAIWRLNKLEIDWLIKVEHYNTRYSLLGIWLAGKITNLNYWISENEVSQANIIVELLERHPSEISDLIEYLKWEIQE